MRGKTQKSGQKKAPAITEASKDIRQANSTDAEEAVERDRRLGAGRHPDYLRAGATLAAAAENWLTAWVTLLSIDSAACLAVLLNCS